MKIKLFLFTLPLFLLMACVEKDTSYEEFELHMAQIEKDIRRAEAAVDYLREDYGKTFTKLSLAAYWQNNMAAVADSVGEMEELVNLMGRMNSDLKGELEDALTENERLQAEIWDLEMELQQCRKKNTKGR